MKTKVAMTETMYENVVLMMVLSCQDSACLVCNRVSKALTQEVG